MYIVTRWMDAGFNRLSRTRVGINAMTPPRLHPQETKGLDSKNGLMEPELIHFGSHPLVGQ
jgi:hypothetical protein